MHHSRRGLLALLGTASVVTACGSGLPASGVPESGLPASGIPAPRRVAYGDRPSQFGELTLPVGDGPVRGTLVLVHGGFWRSSYGLELARPLAVDLATAGFAAWNVEYRRVSGRHGADEGGWPATFEDVAAAVDHLAELREPRLDLARVVGLGHSAGGHLVGWLAARPGLPAGAPGAGPRVTLRGAVSQAGVLDLVDGADLGGGAVTDLLGGAPADVPDRYAMGSPAERLPVGVPVVCVHGTADGNVPLRQSRRYVERARAAGDPAEFVTIDGADHFAVIDPTTAAWRACTDAIARVL
ncbi:MAG: alpha/beta hydrolase [Pseudonocardia sp.]|nr:alpha/beta hydrolase [Pseudonocardia sp.]